MLFDTTMVAFGSDWNGKEVLRGWSVKGYIHQTLLYIYTFFKLKITNVGVCLIKIINAACHNGLFF